MALFKKDDVVILKDSTIPSPTMRVVKYNSQNKVVCSWVDNEDKTPKERAFSEEALELFPEVSEEEMGSMYKNVVVNHADNNSQQELQGGGEYNAISSVRI